MSNSPQDDLLQRGIAAARAGQADEARRLLAQAIQQNPRSETAWLWMSSIVQTNDQRIHCLRQVLALNPNNEFALKGLRALGALPDEAPAAPSPVQPAPEPAYESTYEEAAETGYDAGSDEVAHEAEAPSYEEEAAYE